MTPTNPSNNMPHINIVEVEIGSQLKTRCKSEHEALNSGESGRNSVRGAEEGLLEDRN